MRQTFDTLVIHTPHAGVDCRLPWTFSTFDYRELCGLLWDQCDAEFETAKVEGRAPGIRPCTPTAATCARRCVVDALGWRRVLGGRRYQPPDAPLSRGLEVHPARRERRLEIWIDRGYVPAGYGWSFPAGDEVRVGVGSFDPRFHVKEPAVRLATTSSPGGPLPGQLDPAQAAPSDRRRRLLRRGLGRPLPAADRRGHPNRVLLRDRLRARAARGGRGAGLTREQALGRYGEFSDAHERKFNWMLRTQRLVPRVPPRLLGLALRRMESERFVNWSFGHYLRIAPPTFAGTLNGRSGRSPRAAAAPQLAAPR